MRLLGPMHVCLNVDKIIRLVAHELVGSKSKATAVALACCRKVFEDSALDALWRTQEELLALLKCLPRDVWSERGRVVSTLSTRVFSPLNCLISMSFGRLPTGPEWARFRNYAQRMRQLKDFGDCHPSLPRNPAIITAVSGTPFVGNRTALRCFLWIPRLWRKPLKLFANPLVYTNYRW